MKYFAVNYVVAFICLLVGLTFMDWAYGWEENNIFLTMIAIVLFQLSYQIWMKPSKAKTV